jgi:hypothetical protein
MQGIANAFFFGVAIFSVTFACFILSVRAQDKHYRPEHAQLDKLLYRLVPPTENVLRAPGTRPTPTCFA